MPRQGGSYLRDKPGAKPKLVARTESHPDGDAPRDAKGQRLDRPPKAAKAEPKKAEKAPVQTPGKED